jgi:hypothetical protein
MKVGDLVRHKLTKEIGIIVRYGSAYHWVVYWSSYHKPLKVYVGKVEKL